MTRSLRLATGLAATALLVACSGDPVSNTTDAGGAPVDAVARSRVIPGQYIVVLRDDVGDVRGTARRLLGVGQTGRVTSRDGVDERVLQTYQHSIKGFAARMSAEQAAEMRQDPAVLSIESDVLDYLDPTVDEPNAVTTQGSATWGLDRIDQRDRPVDGNYRYRTTGAGVRVYIIDSGIRYTHQEFEGRGTLGADLTGVPGEAGLDCYGHGTHVAGTVGGKTFGVAKKATLVVVRTFGCPDPTTGAAPTSPRSRTIAAVDWVTANAVLPAVANMSLGGNNEAFPGMSGLDLAVEKGVAKGIVFAVAAGNDNGLNACQKSPANAPNAITIGSTTSTDARSSFSNIGTCLDIFGPGSSITSATWTNDTGSRTISGTSMATPHVAGVAAMVLEEHPAWTPAQVREEIVGNATPNKIPSPGTGSPNLLLFALGAPSFGFSAAPPSNTVEGSTFAASASSTDDDGAAASISWNMGDGTTKTGASITHKYADNGSYLVTVTATDALGAKTSSTRTVVVANASPVVRGVQFEFPTMNSPYAGQTFNVGVKFDDAGVVDGPWAYRMVWGDGTETNGTVAAQGTFALSHVYTTPGSRTATIYVKDKDGTASSRSFPVVVKAVPAS